MLKPPKLAGPGQLCVFVEQLGFDHCVKALDVHPSTMRGWMRGARPVPQLALMALYWLTNYGFSAAAAEVHWSHQFLIGRNRQLVDQLAQVRTVNRVLCGLLACPAGLTDGRAFPGSVANRRACQLSMLASSFGCGTALQLPF